MEQNEVGAKDIYFEIKAIKNYIFSKWKILILSAIIGASVGLLISFLLKPNYSGSLKFIIDDGKRDNGGLVSIASSFGLGRLTSDNSLFNSSNIIEFLKTRPLVEEALLRPIRENKYNKMTYIELYLKENNIKEKWKDSPNLKNIKFKVGENKSDFSRTKDSILGVIYDKILENELTISQPDEDNSIIIINANTKSEVFSKNFPFELIDVASFYYSDSKTKKAKISVDVLQKQVDSVKFELYKSMGNAASSSDEVFGLNPAMNVQRLPSAKQQIQVKVNTSILEELVKNLEISKMTLLNDTPIINIIEKPVYPLKIDKFSKIKGIIFGGFIGGFLILIYLLLKRYLKKLSNSTK